MIENMKVEFGYPNQRFVLHADKSVDSVIIGTKS